MKPLNLDTKPCSPISSNCIVWQGPDIPCIKLCNGDTISDVVAALATELCNLLDSLDPGSYDLTCLTTGRVPANTQELIQLLINKICSIQVIEGPPGVTGTPGTNGTNGYSGRGVAVFVQSTEPTLTDFNTLYGTVQGFGVNYISGNNQIKAGDIWIESCPPA
jgi:hypothetical protein